jgi:hypothetical protein
MLREAGSSYGENPSIRITGTAAELDEIRKMLAGTLWLSVHQGVPWSRTRYEDIPPPERDPLVPVEWRVPKPPPVGVCTARDMETVHAAIRERPKFKLLLGPDFDEEGWRSPSFYLSHLGAGGIVGSYAASARTLAGAGWECLRSRRDAAGKVWERWMLPYSGAAQGMLAEVLKNNRAAVQWRDEWKRDWNTIVEWACHNVSFGSLDVAVQRACLTVD